MSMRGLQPKLDTSNVIPDTHCPSYHCPVITLNGPSLHPSSYRSGHAIRIVEVDFYDPLRGFVRSEAS